SAARSSPPMPENRLTWVRRSGMGLVLVILAVYIEGIQFTQLQGLQPGKVGLVAEHQVAAGDAPAVKHLVGDFAVPPGSVDQVLHVPAVFDLSGKKGKLVQ